MAIQTLFGSVEQEPSLLERLKTGVAKTRAGLVSRIEDTLALPVWKQSPTPALIDVIVMSESREMGVSADQPCPNRFPSKASRIAVAAPFVTLTFTAPIAWEI